MKTARNRALISSLIVGAAFLTILCLIQGGAFGENEQASESHPGKKVTFYVS